MFTIALIGPDGAGKTTLARRMESSLPLRCKYVYMGINPDASNHMLPTTRLWHRLRGPDDRGPSAPDERCRERPKSMLRRCLRPVKSAAGLVNRMADEWYRQLLVWRYTRRGCIVLQDRHYWFDFYSYDVVQRKRSVFQWIHGMMLKHLFPKPDMTIMLDAPGEVLFARKGEGTPESLEQRRRQYHELGRQTKNFFVVDATQSEDKVMAQLQDLVVRFAEHGSGSSGRTQVSSPGTSDRARDAGRRKTALVTNADGGTAITIIRSLQRQGWRIIAADADPAALGFHSRAADDTLVYPAPTSDAKAFVQCIADAVTAFEVDLVWPVTDATIVPLVNQQPCLPSQTTLLAPDQESLRTANCKWTTVRLAEELGIAVPRTELVHTVDEACQSVGSFRWPVVLKPQSSCRVGREGGVERFEVRYANDLPRLCQEMEQWEGRCAVLLQEYTGGQGVGLEVLMSHGRPLAAFQHRRLREVPVSGGASSYRASMPLDPELYQRAVELLRAIDWTGLAMVEFKVDGDEYRLMEINGRPWGSFPLAVQAGVDFPALAAQLATEGDEAFPSEPLTSYSTRARSRNVRLDLTWIAAVLAGDRKYEFLPYPSRVQGLAALLGYFNPLAKTDLWTWRDPLPGILEYPAAIAKICHKWKYRHERSLESAPCMPDLVASESRASPIVSNDGTFSTEAYAEEEACPRG